MANPSSLFYHLIAKRRRELPFLVFSSFLLTFIAARTVVYLSVKGLLPANFFLNVSGVHVHHLSYGIFILAVLGYVLLIYPNFVQKHKWKLSMLYGIGLGLTFDEFGMWIRLQDGYWIRTSYDAIIVISAIFLNIVYFKPFWHRVGRMIQRRWMKWFRKTELEIEHAGHELINNFTKRT